MARIRSVKPEFWLDRKLARGVSRDARLLYIGLWNYADEHGRLHGDPAVIKGQVFPYDDDADIEQLLGELVALGRVQAYGHEGDPFLYLPKLSEHQRLESTKVPSRLPEPPDPAEFPPPDPDSRAPGADKSARDPDDHGSDGNSPSDLHTQIGADEYARDADSSETNVVQQVAGSRLQVAGSRWSPPGGAQTPPPTDTQRSKVITDAYAAVQPMCRWPAINGVVLKAIRTERYTDPEIHDALLRLAAEGRSVTVETLRIELDGLPPSRAPANPRQAQALATVAHFQALEADPPSRSEIAR